MIEWFVAGWALGVIAVLVGVVTYTWHDRRRR